MSKIIIKNAVKKYGDNTVIKDLSVDIEEGSLFTLLGPSGCGKTTLLRMIAGFNSIEGGDIYFNDLRVNDLDPSKRNIGMVFQNYAIFPHLSVRKNVEFGLKQRKIDKSEMAKEVDKFLELMQIDGYQDRLPDKLSGGQQQRVALARALVIQPDVLLMDEPLSNLDAKLRIEMREAIREIQKEVGITTVYVTHDQEEAMAISDVIAVMRDGVIEQLGTPKEIYHRPSNTFVASFIGRTNILRGHYDAAKKEISLKNGYVFNYDLNDTESQDVAVSIRPEDFYIVEDGQEGLKTEVDIDIYLGLNTHYHLISESGEKVEMIVGSRLEDDIQKGETLTVGIEVDKINVYSKDGLVNLVTYEESK